VLRFNPFQHVDGLDRGVVKGQTGTGRRPLFMPSELRKVDDGRYVLTAAGTGYGGGDDTLR
jgi:hypothetical protein